MLFEIARTFVLIGAGQNWRLDQYKPMVQPNGRIHVVDPLIESLERPEDIRSHLDALGPNNHFFHMPWDAYAVRVLDAPEDEQIVVISYTEAVLSDIQEVFPRITFISLAHAAEGLDLSVFDDFPNRDQLGKVNSIRETALKLYNVPSHAVRDALFDPDIDYLGTYNDIVAELSELATENAMIRTLINYMISEEGLLTAVQRILFSRVRDFIRQTGSTEILDQSFRTYQLTT